MKARFYDVVVLGRSLGALTTAALLARRDFRVLLLGQGQHPPTYRFDRHLLARRSFTLLFANSPVWKRILRDLAQTQTFRQRTRNLDPMFTLLAPHRRLQVPPDAELFAREIDREFPEVRQLVEELYDRLALANAAIDQAFDRDLAWPPSTLMERFETGRAASLLPFSDGESAEGLLAKFPPEHPYREMTSAPARMACDLMVPPQVFPSLALARLVGMWTRGTMSLDRGETDLEEFLIERIQAHGGICRLEQRATEIVVGRGRVRGVIEDGEEEPTGAAAVVTNLTGEQIAELTRGAGIKKSAERDWPRVEVRAGRFVVSVVVDRHGLPEALGEENFILPGAGAAASPREPGVHLQRLPALGASDGKPIDRLNLLVAEASLPVRGPLSPLEARDAIMTLLRAQLPYLDQHIVAVDSPHDGLPIVDYSTGTPREVDRIHLGQGNPGAEPMECQYAVEPPALMGLAGEPVRGPVLGTFLVGKSVLPGLGQEGELLAAWTAARIITRRDSARQKRRHQMWTKIETG